VAVLLGAAFAGETLSRRALVAAILIIGSVAMVITAQQLRARVEAPFSAAVAPAD
jgi:drug/metabolite transporter (DMT)-like permease